MKKRIFIVLAVFCFLALSYIIYDYVKPSEYLSLIHISEPTRRPG